jgi:hypothetical protein
MFPKSNFLCIKSSCRCSWNCLLHWSQFGFCRSSNVTQSCQMSRKRFFLFGFRALKFVLTFFRPAAAFEWNQNLFVCEVAPDYRAIESCKFSLLIGDFLQGVSALSEDFYQRLHNFMQQRCANVASFLHHKQNDLGISQNPACQAERSRS